MNTDDEYETQTLGAAVAPERQSDRRVFKSKATYTAAESEHRYFIRYITAMTAILITEAIITGLVTMYV